MSLISCLQILFQLRDGKLQEEPWTFFVILSLLTDATSPVPCDILIDIDFLCGRQNFGGRDRRIG